MKTQIGLLSLLGLLLSQGAMAADLPHFNYPDPGPLESREVKAVIKTASLSSAKQVETTEGTTNFLLIETKYCGGDTEPTFERIGEPHMQYDVNLGGQRSTLRQIQASFVFYNKVHKNEALSDGCNIKTTTLKLKCNVLKGYSGAGCDFFINERQGLYIEILKSKTPTVQLYNLN